MSLENIENTYGSVAEYNRQQDEKEYADKDNNVPDFKKYYYEAVEKKMAALEAYIKDLTDISDNMRGSYDDALMADPYMPDDDKRNMDIDYDFNYNRITRLIDTAQKELGAIINSLVHSYDINDRIYAAHKGFMLETLVNDKSVDVRVAVAEMGYGHERLVNDISATVRYTVGKNTDDYDIFKQLVNDEDIPTRRTVLNSNSIELLEVLAKDSNPYIRHSAQKQLDIIAVDANNERGIAMNTEISANNNDFPYIHYDKPVITEDYELQTSSYVLHSNTYENSFYYRCEIGKTDGTLQTNDIQNGTPIYLDVSASVYNDGEEITARSLNDDFAYIYANNGDKLEVIPITIETVIMCENQIKALLEHEYNNNAEKPKKTALERD